MQSEIKNINSAYILFTQETCYFGSFTDFRQEKFGSEKLYLSFPENSIYIGQEAFDKMGNGSAQKDYICCLSLPTASINELLKNITSHYAMREWISTNDKGESNTIEIKKITWTFCWSVMLHHIAKKFRSKAKAFNYNITNVKVMIHESFESKVKSYIQTVMKQELKEMQLEFYNTSDTVQFGIKYSTCQRADFMSEVKRRPNNGDNRQFYETRESYIIVVNTDLYQTDVCYYKVSAKDKRSRIWKSGRVVNHCIVTKGPENSSLKFGSGDYQGAELDFFERKFKEELKEEFESGDVDFDKNHQLQCLTQARSFGQYDKLGFAVDCNTGVDIEREEYEQEVDALFVNTMLEAIDKIVKHIGKEKVEEIKKNKAAGLKYNTDPIQIYCMPIGWLGHTSIFRYNKDKPENNGPIAEYFSKLKSEKNIHINWEIRCHNEGDDWMDMAGSYTLGASFVKEDEDFCKQQNFGEFKNCYHSFMSQVIDLTLKHGDNWTALLNKLGKEFNAIDWYMANSNIIKEQGEARAKFRELFKFLSTHHIYEEDSIYQDWTKYRREGLKIADEMFEEISDSYNEYIEKKRKEEEEKKRQEEEEKKAQRQTRAQRQTKTKKEKK